MLILHHIIFLFIIYIQNIDVLCINCYIGDDNELTHCVGDARICPNKNPIYFFNTTCPTYSSGCLNLGVRKLFNVQSVLHTVNHPNSKIQLQNISCLNFNVIVP